MKQNVQHFRPPQGIERSAHLWLNDTSDKGVPRMPKIFLAGATN